MTRRKLRGLERLGSLQAGAGEPNREVPVQFELRQVADILGQVDRKRSPGRVRLVPSLDWIDGIDEAAARGDVYILFDSRSLMAPRGLDA